MSIVVETNFQLDQVFRRNDRCVIKFGAQWCAPCKRFAPNFKIIAEQNSNISFVSVDIDDAPDVADRYNISNVPAFVFIKNAKEFTRQIGADESKIKKTIEQLNL